MMAEYYYLYLYVELSVFLGYCCFNSDFLRGCIIFDSILSTSLQHTIDTEKDKQTDIPIYCITYLFLPTQVSMSTLWYL